MCPTDTRLEYSEGCHSVYFFHVGHVLNRVRILMACENCTRLRGLSEPVFILVWVKMFQGETYLLHFGMAREACLIRLRWYWTSGCGSSATF